MVIPEMPVLVSGADHAEHGLGAADVAEEEVEQRHSSYANQPSASGSSQFRWSCEYCGRVAGKLEQGCEWKGQIVCAECYSTLAASSPDTTSAAPSRSGLPTTASAWDGPLSPGRHVDEAALRDSGEQAAFYWLVFFSLAPWLFLGLWIVASLGIVLFAMGLIALGRLIAEFFAAAYIKTNAIEVSESQLPEIHRIVNNFAERLGKAPPTVYVLQENVWNSLAMKLAGRRLVVLLSGALDSLLLQGSMKQVAWLVGHEMGHHYAGHLNFWRHTTATMGSWFIWVGLWYKRRCELTCDRYGLVCADSLRESLRAVCNMAAGAQFGPRVHVGQAIAQWNRHRSEFFVRYRTLYSTHPHTLWRLQGLTNAARSLGILN